MFRWIRCKMGRIVYRLTQDGEVSAYAKLAIRDPEIRQYYVEMAKRRKRNKRRIGDMAVSDYFQGNDLLWKKLYGDQEKPADWSWKDAQLPPVART